MLHSKPQYRLQYVSYGFAEFIRTHKRHTARLYYTGLFSYRFSATEWPNGHYVHTLSGLKESPMSYHFWLLYKLKSCPDTQNPPSNNLVAPTGVDDLIVQDGEHYLFWYKKL